MISSDTIAALSSPPGRSERALIRVSGPAASALTPEVIDHLPEKRRCGAARLRFPDGLELPVLVARSAAPASYTGQDTVEILLPGNPALVARVVDRICSIDGIRPAGPGEFTARAYMAGKLDLAQAEGVAALIAARTDEERAAAAELMSGHAGALYHQWADELATLLALVEAGIDFTDQEDVVAIAPVALAARLSVLARAIQARLGGAAEVRQGTPRVALVGRPNAGKSTLFNALLGRRRAVESPVAGTTRDVLEEELDLSRDAAGAGIVIVMDLAGLDAAPSGAIDAGAQDRAREAVGRADAIVYCDEFGLFDLPMPAATPVIRVRTKADRIGGRDGPERIAVCALDGRNLDVLRRAVADAACGSRSGAAAGLVPRHRRALTGTLAVIQSAEQSAGQSGRRFQHPELAAGLLREALDGLGELTGRLTADDVLGRIFATFCIGK